MYGGDVLFKFKKSLFDEYNSSPSRLIKEMQNYLELRQFEVYKTITGLCNPVLSKNPFTSNFLNLYLSQKQVQLSFKVFLRALGRFLFYNTILTTLEVIQILFTKKIRTNDAPPRPVIITFFNFSKKEQSYFDELYLTGLQRHLLDKKVEYIYFPKFHQLSLNPFKALKEVKSVKEINPNLISVYELIPRRKIFQLIWLSFGYFFSNLGTLRPGSRDAFDQYYNVSLVEALSSSEVNKFVVFIATQELMKKVKINKAILWYENQSIDKCIIRAMRDSGQKVEIIGCQFFLLIERETNVYPSKYEISTNYLPDRILLMQDVPPEVQSPERYDLGIGLRYRYLEKYADGVPNGKRRFTVFLTTYFDKNDLTFRLLSESSLRFEKLHFKMHPVMSKVALPTIEGWTEVQGTPEEALVESQMVISSETGIVYEAIALGRQVIILGSNDSASFFIPPYEYEGKLWIRATTVEELEKGLETFSKIKQLYPEELINLSQKFRKTFFKNSPKDILEILEL